MGTRGMRNRRHEDEGWGGVTHECGVLLSGSGLICSGNPYFRTWAYFLLPAATHILVPSSLHRLCSLDYIAQLVVSNIYY